MITLIMLIWDSLELLYNLKKIIGFLTKTFENIIERVCNFRSNIFNVLRALYMVQTQWKGALFVIIPQAISRTTGPNIGLIVLILMHFPC